ncbi:hypothetical protein BGX28_005771 [Mortierella sp. GBA30]|nr:hypothetical protein BGX28_005771 [Mortierella sp. GBA30]
MPARTRSALNPSTGLLYVPSGIFNGTMMVIYNTDTNVSSFLAMPSASGSINLVNFHYYSLVWSMYRNSMLLYGRYQYYTQIRNPNLVEYKPTLDQWTRQRAIILATSIHIAWFQVGEHHNLHRRLNLARIDSHAWHAALLCTRTAYNGSKMVLFGGQDGSNSTLGSIFIQDLKTLVWTRGVDADASQKRRNMVCTAAGDNFITWGGDYNDSHTDKFGKPMIIYNLRTDQWTNHFSPIPAAETSPLSMQQYPDNSNVYPRQSSVYAPVVASHSPPPGEHPPPPVATLSPTHSTIVSGTQASSLSPPTTPLFVQDQQHQSLNIPPAPPNDANPGYAGSPITAMSLPHQTMAARDLQIYTTQHHEKDQALRQQSVQHLSEFATVGHKAHDPIPPEPTQDSAPSIQGGQPGNPQTNHDSRLNKVESSPSSDSIGADFNYLPPTFEVTRSPQERDSSPQEQEMQRTIRHIKSPQDYSVLEEEERRQQLQLQHDQPPVHQNQQAALHGTKGAQELELEWQLAAIKEQNTQQQLDVELLQFEMKNLRQLVKREVREA